jgi:hypothetical protein
MAMPMYSKMRIEEMNHVFCLGDMRTRAWSFDSGSEYLLVYEGRELGGGVTLPGDVVDGV